MTFTFQKQIQTNQSCFFVFVVERNHDLSVCGCCKVASTVYPSTLLWQIWLVDWVRDVCTVMDALHYLLIAVCGLTSCLLKDDIKLNKTRKLFTPSRFRVIVYHLAGKRKYRHLHFPLRLSPDSNLSINVVSSYGTWKHTINIRLILNVWFSVSRYHRRWIPHPQINSWFQLPLWKGKEGNFLYPTPI